MEPFFIDNPFHYKVRKTMLKFAYGVGATLLVIAFICGGEILRKDFAHRAEIDAQQAKIDATRYYFKADCHNCDHCDRYHLNKGVVAIGTQLSCSTCGVEGKITGRNTEEQYYPHREHLVFSAGGK